MTWCIPATRGTAGRIGSTSHGRPRTWERLGTDRVLGRTSPHREVAGQIDDAEGVPIGQGNATSDREGRFGLRFPPAADSRAQLTTGQTLVLDSQGASVRLTLPELDFDLGGAAGVMGIAPPDTDVALTLRLVDGRAVTTTVRSDLLGRFAFTAANIPGREDWTIGDIGTVRAAIVIEQVHRVVRDSADVAGPVPSPSPPSPERRRQVLLPWASAARGTR